MNPVQWARENQEIDPRLKDSVFAAHMKNEYIDSDIPITLRIFSLDNKNSRLVLTFIQERLVDGLTSEKIEF